MEQESSTKTRFTIAALVVILAFAFQGSRGLWEPDEGRYVRCAYEMHKTGNWITPTINFKPHFTKPPVTYWVIASGISLFGRNEWGARVSHGLAFALTAILVGFLGKRMWDERTGLLACLIYATTMLPFLAGNAVTTDTILTLFETAAVVCFWMSVTGRDNVLKSSLWAMAMWCFFGIAFLTKGPSALLPLAAITAYMLVQKRTRCLPVFVTVLGIIVCAAISLPWFVLVVRQQEGLLSYFLKHEFVGRIVTGEHRRHPGWFGPFKVYLPVLTLGALPWAGLWPVLIRRSRPRVLTVHWWKDLRERPIALLLVLWFGLPLLILSLASSRLPLYVLPLFAPLAMVTARGLMIHFPDQAVHAARLRGKLGTMVVILVIIFVSARAIAAEIPWKRDSRAMWNGIHAVIATKVGDAPYEIVLIRENYDGLAFYSDTNVEFMTTRDRSTPSFISAEHVSEEYDELSSARYTHVFLVRDKHLDTVLKEMRTRGVGYSVEDAPFAHKLVFCETHASGNRVVRLAALGDAGVGDAYQTMVGDALYQIDQTTSVDGVIMLGDNIYGWDGEGKIDDTYKYCFEIPYAPLLENGVKFYAALGNHDYRHGQMDYQIHYPLFNMNGRRYYSKIFGNNIVEVFFIDSDTIKKDSLQVEWLKQALKESVASWKVIAMHHPLYSSAKKYPSDPSMIRLLEPIFVENNVNLVLTGHNHIYERLCPKRGIHYMTVGSAGKVRKGNLVQDNSERIAGDDERNVCLVLQFGRDKCHLTAFSLNEEIVDEGEFECALIHGQNVSGRGHRNEAAPILETQLSNNGKSWRTKTNE